MPSSAPAYIVEEIVCMTATITAASPLSWAGKMGGGREGGGGGGGREGGREEGREGGKVALELILCMVSLS